MTIENTPLNQQHIGDGVTTVFDFTMKTFEAADIVAYFDGVEVVGGYAAAVSADQDVQPGGSVTFDAAPADGVNVNIRREVEADQETDYSQYDAFPEETHENALDKLTMLVQELEETVTRIPQLPIDTQLDGYDLGSPQANTVIMYNAALDGQESTGIDATTFNTNVTATATNAGVAAAAADLAYNWAQQAEDVEVAAGEYSAYHWAQKAEAAGGVVVQVVSMSDGHVGTGANLFSFDDVIPTNSEGDYLMGLQITPTHATNLLRVDVVANLSHSDDGRALSIGLFQNGITNALACVSTTVLSRDPANLVLTYWMPAGTTNQIAFIVNGGANSAGTTTFNGVDGSRRHGGVMASSITITEYKS